MTFVIEHSVVTEKVKSQCSKTFLKQLEEQLQDVYISCSHPLLGFDCFLKEMTIGADWILLPPGIPEFQKMKESHVANYKFQTKVMAPAPDAVERDSRLD